MDLAFITGTGAAAPVPAPDLTGASEAASAGDLFAAMLEAFGASAAALGSSAAGDNIEARANSGEAPAEGMPPLPGDGVVDDEEREDRVAAAFAGCPVLSLPVAVPDAPVVQAAPLADSRADAAPVDPAAAGAPVPGAAAAQPEPAIAGPETSALRTASDLAAAAPTPASETAAARPFDAATTGGAVPPVAGPAVPLDRSSSQTDDPVTPDNRAVAGPRALDRAGRLLARAIAAAEAPVAPARSAVDTVHAPGNIDPGPASAGQPAVPPVAPPAVSVAADAAPAARTSWMADRYTAAPVTAPAETPIESAIGARTGQQQGGTRDSGSPRSGSFTGILEQAFASHPAAVSPGPGPALEREAIPVLEPAATMGAGPHEVADQLVSAMRVQIRGGISEARVKLRPEHLGEVTIEVRVEGDRVSATVHAQRPEVRAEIDAQSQTLRAAFAAQGLTLEELVVSEDGGRREGGRRDEAPGQRERPRHEREAGREFTLDV